MLILKLTFKSIMNRKVTAILTILSITLSLMLLLGVERIRKGAYQSFSNTISGTDLIVGARSGPIQLLLYSVFRLGNATNNISWESYQQFATHPKTKWAIPISLGDSHKGFRVMGTHVDYFKYFRYGEAKALELKEGKDFSADVFHTVIGAEVAERLSYKVGQKITLNHGIDTAGFLNHKDKPFTIVGILERTGTPVDQTVHVSLEGIEAIHIDWQHGAPPMPGMEVSASQTRAQDLTPKSITAFLLGLKSRMSVFRIQRDINDYEQEPLLAVLPGVALQQLWQLVGVAEKALITIASFVVATGLIGMLTVLLTTLNERRREMAILRAVGARPHHVFALLLSESIIMTSVSILLGVGLLYSMMVFVQPLIESQFGLWIPIEGLSHYDLYVILGVLLGGAFSGIIPAWKAYRNTLTDGLTVRL